MTAANLSRRLTKPKVSCQLIDVFTLGRWPIHLLQEIHRSTRDRKFRLTQRRRVSASFENFAAFRSNELQGYHATIKNHCFSIRRYTMYFAQRSKQLVHSLHRYRELAPLSIHLQHDSPTDFSRTYLNFRGRVKCWKKGSF